MEATEDQWDQSDQSYTPPYMTPNSESKIDSKEELGGIDFFPERRGEKMVRSFTRKYLLGDNKDNLNKIRCERSVLKVINDSPLLKLMMSAMKSAGCEVHLDRHIICEPCSSIVSGGYDTEYNQIVVCDNTRTHPTVVHGVLAHEMVHMFDNCRAKMDFKNIDHLVCTELRAANLMHCSFLGAMTMGAASPFNIKQQHQECVKRKALSSVMAVRNIPLAEAEESFERVFTRCYNDLEPLGRRLRRNSQDQERAYRERYHYNYG